MKRWIIAFALMGLIWVSKPLVWAEDIPALSSAIQGLSEEDVFNRGLSYYKAGMAEEALYLFSEVLKQNPNHKQAKQMLEKTLKEQREYLPANLRQEEASTPLPEAAVERALPPKSPLSLPPEKTEVKPQLEGITPQVKKEPLPLPIPVKPSTKLKEKEPPEELEIIPQKPKPKKEKEVVVEKPIPPFIPFLPELADFEFAKALNKKGEYDAATQTLEGLLKKYPQSRITNKISFILADSYLKTKQYDQAINLLEKMASSEDMLKDDAQLLLAQAHQKKGDLDKARIEYLRLSTLLEISLPSPKKEEGSVTPTPTATSTAEEIGLKTLLPPLPQPKPTLAASAHLELGHIWQAKKEYRQALTEYQAVAVNYPFTSSAAEAIYYIGEIYDTVYQIRDYVKAVEAYNRLIKDYPQNRWADKAKVRKTYIEKNYL